MPHPYQGTSPPRPRTGRQIHLWQRGPPQEHLDDRLLENPSLKAAGLRAVNCGCPSFMDVLSF